MIRSNHHTAASRPRVFVLLLLSGAIGACSSSSPSTVESNLGGSSGTGALGGTASGGAGDTNAPAGGATSGSGRSGVGGVIANAGNPEVGGSNYSFGGDKSVGGVAANGGSSTGGSATRGGASSQGGASARGGTSSQVTGGSSSNGGSSNTGGVGIGGATTGGATAKGGVTGTTGGSVATSGGTSATGGGISTGGTTSKGGTSATGGTSSTSCPGETSGVTANKIIHVAPTGRYNNTGATSSSPLDLTSALDLVQAGNMLLLSPGTYSIAYTSGAKNTIVLSKAGTESAPIKIVAANCGRAVIDFSFPEQTWVQDSVGFSLTGSYYFFKGLDITRAGYQGVYVTGQHNTFENCTFHDNRNTGLEINEGGAYTTVIDCDAYRNYDPKKYGGMADGFGPKQTQGPGNKFVGCRSWENSDDGYDAYDSPQSVTFENCWAFRNGVDVWKYASFAGNGNGFKVGGNAKLANHTLTQCVAFGNVVKGFDQNNNSGGITFLNCTAYDNGTNFGVGGTLASGQAHVLKNNVSLGAANNVTAGSIEQNNTWNTGFSVSAADFVSVDLSLATAARSPDGTLPKTNLFRLQSASKLVDAGVDVGLGFAGAAPDLGAFEVGL